MVLQNKIAKNSARLHLPFVTFLNRQARYTSNTHRKQILMCRISQSRYGLGAADPKSFRTKAGGSSGFAVFTESESRAGVWSLPFEASDRLPDAESSLSSSSASLISSMCCVRRSRSLRRQRRMIFSNSAGRFGARAPGGGGSFCRIAEIVDILVAPSNGRRPVTIS